MGLNQESRIHENVEDRDVVIGVCDCRTCNGQGGADDEAITLRVGALGGTARFNFVKTADWGTGYNARVDITNIGQPRSRAGRPTSTCRGTCRSNVSSIPQCSGSVTDNCYTVVSDIGAGEHRAASSTPARQTQSTSARPGRSSSRQLRGRVRLSTRCGAPLTGQSTPCNGSNDVTPPSAASNFSIFGTGSALVDLFWSNATDNVGVTGYILRYATRAAPALENRRGPVHRADHARAHHAPGQRHQLHLLRRGARCGRQCRAVHRIGGDAHRAAADHRHVQHRQHLAGGSFPGQFRVTNTGSVPLDNWRFSFSFTGSFQSVWDGVVSGSPRGRSPSPRPRTTFQRFS